MADNRTEEQLRQDFQRYLNDIDAAILKLKEAGKTQIAEKLFEDMRKVSSTIADLPATLQTQATELKKILGLANAAVDKFASTSDVTLSTFTSILQELTRGKEATNKITSATRALSGVSEELLGRQLRIADLDEKDIKRIERKINAQELSLEYRVKELSQIKDIAKKDSRDAIALGNAKFLLEPNLGLISNLKEELKFAKEEQQLVNDSLGDYADVLETVKGVLPDSINKFLGIDSVLKKNKEEFQDFVEELRQTKFQQPFFKAKTTFETNREKLGISQQKAAELEEERDKLRSRRRQITGNELIKARQEAGKKGLNALERQQAEDRVKQLEEERDSIKTREKEITVERRNLYNTIKRDTVKLGKAREDLSNVNKQIYEEAVKGDFGKDLNVFTGLIKNATEKSQRLIKNPATALGAFATLLKRSFFEFNDQLVQVGRNLNITKTSALGIRMEFAGVASASNEAFITTSKLLEATLQFNETIGLTGRLNAQNSAQFIKLNQLLGLSVESASQLQLIAEATNTPLQQQTYQQYEAIQAVSAQFKTQLNIKQVMDEVGKAGAYALVQFKGSAEALAEGAAMAKALGLELSEVNQIAGQLIQFEDSIRSELEAELLLGRQINLERARFAALNNDQKTLMEEINNQMGDFSDFQDLTKIQQEAFASALGLSVDKLSNMLLLEQYREKTAKEVIALEGEQVAANVERLKTQEAFNALIDKFKSTIVDLVAGPLSAFGTILEFAAENAGLLVTSLGILAGGRILAATAALAANLTAAGAGAGLIGGILTGGLAIGIITALTAAIYGLYKSTQDSVRVGDMGYDPMSGKTMISTKEGDIFKPSDRDQIAVGPNVIDSLMAPNQIVNVTTPQQQVIVDSNEALLKEIQGLRADNKRLMNRPVEAEISVRNFERVKRKQTSYI